MEEGAMLAQLANQGTRKVINAIQDNAVFFFYTQALTIIQTLLQPAFLHTDAFGNDRGLIYFLYGDYHTGKSYLLKYFMVLMEKAHPEIWSHAEEPIVKIDLNNHINTAVQLLVYLLDKLGRPIDAKVLAQWKRSSLEKEYLQARLIALLQRGGTRLLLLDECQKLLLAQHADILDIFELLKDLSCSHNWGGGLRTQIVLCGTKDGIPLLEAADWIQGRTRAVRLYELEGLEYGQLLFKIYRYYTSIGVSEDWSLVSKDEDGDKQKLNAETALYLFNRTRGKVGLTVELIRNAVLLGLNNGRLYPEKGDYEAIRLDDKACLIERVATPPSIGPPEHAVRMMLGDRCCKVAGCPRATKPYAQYRSLVKHYKIHHPDVDLTYGGAP